MYRIGLQSWIYKEVAWGSDPYFWNTAFCLSHQYLYFPILYYWRNKNLNWINWSFFMMCKYHLSVVVVILHATVKQFWKTIIKKNQNEQSFNQSLQLFIFSWNKYKQRYKSMPILTLWPMVWLDGYGISRNTIGKLIQGGLGKMYVDRCLWMGIDCEDIWIPCECSPKDDLRSEENLNNQGNRMA